MVKEEVIEKLMPVCDRLRELYTKPIVDMFVMEFGEENVDFYEEETIQQIDICENIIHSAEIVKKEEDNENDGPKYFLLFMEPKPGYESFGFIENMLCTEEADDLDEVFENIVFDDSLVRLLSVYQNTIVVRFPRVIVSNEEGKSTEIKNLFVKVIFDYRGRLVEQDYCYGFTLNRTHYTYAHFINNYMHSHVSSIPTSNLTRFQGSCTGSGPINETISALRIEYDEAQWMQFCWDLAKYVTVESLEGGPYHKLDLCKSEISTGEEISLRHYYRTLLETQTLTNSVLRRDGPSLTKEDWINFITYLTQNDIVPFHWVGDKWEIAASDTDYIFLISTAFLRWLRENKESIMQKYSDEYTVENFNTLIGKYTRKVAIDYPKIYTLGNNETNRRIVDNLRGRYVLTFKGEDYNLEIDEPTVNISEAPTYRILEIKFIVFITGVLTIILNTQYGNSERNSSETRISFTDF